jgi:hypothetical protein
MGFALMSSIFINPCFSYYFPFSIFCFSTVCWAGGRQHGVVAILAIAETSDGQSGQQLYSMTESLERLDAKSRIQLGKV